MTADRVVRVSPERLPGWVERFAGRHGDVVVEPGPATVILTAADESVAAVTVPFPPLADSPDPLTVLFDHCRRDRLVGALLVRRGGYAVGLFAGRHLRSSKVGHSYVQGRTKAGGWSQQRFARRRAGQRERDRSCQPAGAGVWLRTKSRLPSKIAGASLSSVATW